MWENKRNNNTYLVQWGFLCNIVINSTIAHDNYSTITVIDTHRGVRYEVGGDSNILKTCFVFQASCACIQNS